ncbi:hypothetical protein [Nesterenkonia suensis]
MFSASAAQLDRIAATYEEMAMRYQRAADLGREHRSQLTLGRQTAHWDSLAGDAFRSAIDVLSSDSAAVSGEAEELASEATIIAGSMREWAVVARHLASMLDAVSGMDLAGIAGEFLLRRAREAVHDVSSLVSFVQDYGGIPAGLGEAITDLLMPEGSHA